MFRGYTLVHSHCFKQLLSIVGWLHNPAYCTETEIAGQIYNNTPCVHRISAYMHENTVSWTGVFHSACRRSIENLLVLAFISSHFLILLSNVLSHCSILCGSHIFFYIYKRLNNTSIILEFHSPRVNSCGPPEKQQTSPFTSCDSVFLPGIDRANIKRLKSNSLSSLEAMSQKYQA